MQLNATTNLLVACMIIQTKVCNLRCLFQHSISCREILITYSFFISAYKCKTGCISVQYTGTIILLIHKFYFYVMYTVTDCKVNSSAGHGTAANAIFTITDIVTNYTAPADI
jgi:hypothetical protein